MIITKEQMLSFEKVARPLIKWLNDNRHPHVTAIITSTSAEIMERIAAFPITDYIKD